MKKILLFGALLISALIFSQEPVIEPVSFLTEDTTWENDITLNGKIVVNSGVTLTIMPGTVIKATPKSSPVNASALVIAKGGKIMAEGTAALPIIFTETADGLTSAMVASGTYFDTNSQSITERGKWGGIIILGNNVTGAGENGTATIEGIGAGQPWGSYGGTATEDNSGILKFVSIRHGGATVAPGSEINGLTLGGVGNGTVIENIEIISNDDDGIELFGGNVDVTNLLVYNQKDDAIDIDQAYSGTITNAIVAMGTDSDNVFEIDGTESTSTPVVTGSYTINKVTAIGVTNNTELNQYGHWKSNATGANNNIVYKGFGALTTIEGIDTDTYNDGSLTFSNLDFVTTSSLAQINLATDDFGTKGSASLSSTEAEVLSSKVLFSGADDSVFAGWTAYFSSGTGVLNVEDAKVSENVFAVYPNPFDNIISVSNQVKVISLKLFNVTGQLVKSNLDSNSVNVSDLASGIYFLEVASEGFGKNIRKVIKK